MQWTDPIHDMGVFAASKFMCATMNRMCPKESNRKWLTILLYAAGVFNLGVEKTHGKSYLVLSPRITVDDMVETFTRVTGQAAIYEPLSAEEFAELAVLSVGPAFKQDAKEMMEWAAVMPADKICYGALDADQDDSLKELGLSATSFENWLHRTGWKGPA